MHEFLIDYPLEAHDFSSGVPLATNKLPDLQKVASVELTIPPRDLRALVVATGNGQKLPNMRRLLQHAGWNAFVGRAEPNGADEASFHNGFTADPGLVAALKVLQHGGKEISHSVVAWVDGQRQIIQQRVLDEMLVGVFIKGKVSSDEKREKKSGRRKDVDEVIPALTQLDRYGMSSTGTTVFMASDVMVYRIDDSPSSSWHVMHKVPPNFTKTEIFRELNRTLAHPDESRTIKIGVRWGGAAIAYPESPQVVPKGAAGHIDYELGLRPIPSAVLALFVWGYEDAFKQSGVAPDKVRQAYVELMSSNVLDAEDRELIQSGARARLWQTNGGWQIESGLLRYFIESIDGITVYDERFPMVYDAMVAAVTGGPWQSLDLIKTVLSVAGRGCNSTNELTSQITSAARKYLKNENRYPWLVWKPPQEIWST